MLGVLRLLRLDEDRAEADERRRGVPGQPLLGPDRAAVELKPLRLFAPDEVHSTPSPSPRRSTPSTTIALSLC